MSPPHPHHHQQQQQQRYHHEQEQRYHNQEPDEPTPICRCRVLYLGSAVPHVTKDGLQGIQEPLKELYPEDGALGAKGIDSWLSVWSNGFLLENVDENRKKVTRFFPIEALHYCAAVRYVLVPGSDGGEKNVQRFLPLDSPFARNPNINHPPLFAAILRRTTGIKVLECHVFICKRETAANALVRCAFHAYADSTYAKHLENGGAQSLYGTIGAAPNHPVSPMAQMTVVDGRPANGNGPANGREYQQSVIEVSEDSINSIEKVEEWKVLANGNSSHHKQQRIVPNGASSSPSRENGTSPDEISVANGDDNHKVWANKSGVGDPSNNQEAQQSPEGIYADYGSTLRSFRSSASGLSHRNRPRQMMMPSSPPPPPIPEEFHRDSTSESAKKEKKKKRRSKSRDTVDGNGNGMNGRTMGSRKQSMNSLSAPPRGMNGHGPPRGMPPPPHMMIPHHNMQQGGKAGTFSARDKHARGMPPPFMMFPPQHHHQGGYGPPPHFPPPPHLMPPPGHPLYGMIQPRPGSQAFEEPIYMPHNARPLSPTASYQPGHFPHEAYYNDQQMHRPQQYATIDKSNKYRKNNKNSSAKNSKASSKHVSSDSNADNDDSEFAAGIYKKGHINERAFSYSIRNEQRSRSYGSLSNMQLTPNGEQQNGDVKHEGKIMHHMMTDLDLAEDAIERSEVPPGLFHPDGRNGGPHHPMMYGAPPPHMMIVPDPIKMKAHQNGGAKKKR